MSLTFQYKRTLPCIMHYFWHLVASKGVVCILLFYCSIIGLKTFINTKIVSSCSATLLRSFSSLECCIGFSGTLVIKFYPMEPAKTSSSEERLYQCVAPSLSFSPSASTSSSSSAPDWSIRDNELQKRKRIACQILGKAGLFFSETTPEVTAGHSRLTGRDWLFPQPVFKIFLYFLFQFHRQLFSVTMKTEVFK